MIQLQFSYRINEILIEVGIVKAVSCMAPYMVQNAGVDFLVKRKYNGASGITIS